MITVRTVLDNASLVAAIAAIEAEARERMRLVAEVLGQEVIAYLRSLTDEMRPPARGYTRAKQRKDAKSKRRGRVHGPLDVRRPAHPGHWADITGALANGYSYEVDASGGRVVLHLRNTVEYAVYLEERHGYYVLSGIAGPDGPAMRILRRIIPAVAPGWRFTI